MGRQLTGAYRALAVVAAVAVVSMTAGLAASAVPAPTAAVAVPAQPTAAGAVVSVTPARIADSRSNQQINGPVPALGTASVQVTGNGGVPALGVAAAVLNVTVVSPQSAGYITVWPSGIGRTNTSNLNFQAGQNIPNTVIVPVGPDGKIQLFNGSWGAVHLLVDVTGYTLDGTPSALGAMVPVTPTRIADSRIKLQIPAALPDLGTVGVQVTGQGGIPATGVAAVVLNVTVVDPQSAGYITVWPSGIARTNTSNLNFQAGQNIPNTVIVPVGPDGKIQLFNGSGGTVHLVVDVTGYTVASTAGFVWAWGTAYTLGSGGYGDSSVPVAVSGLTDVTAIAGNGAGGYALRGDGTVWAWGYNGSGQLGNGDVGLSLVPVQVSVLSTVTAIASGDATGYALREDGTVWAWGGGSNGALGNGGATAASPWPVQVSGLTNVTAVAGAGRTGYALRGDGTVWAWGYGGNGQLGNGSSGDSHVPVRVSGLANITAVAGGSWYNGYALGSDGTVWAWGEGGFGGLGNGGYSTSLVPVRVSGLTGVTAIAGGRYNGYAVRGDGTVAAWGPGYQGQLGNGGTTASSVPVSVFGLADVTAIAGGDCTGYAVRRDGTVRAWGHGDRGALGNGGTADSLVPVPVSGLANITAIAAGGSTGFALTR